MDGIPAQLSPFSRALQTAMPTGAPTRAHKGRQWSLPKLAALMASMWTHTSTLRILTDRRRPGTQLDTGGLLLPPAVVSTVPYLPARGKGRVDKRGRLGDGRVLLLLRGSCMCGQAPHVVGDS